MASNSGFFRKYPRNVSLVTAVPLALAAIVACSSDFEQTAAMGEQALVSGLDARPSNTTCVAPDRPSSDIQLVRAFGTLTLSTPVDLMQRPGDSSRYYAVEKGGKIKRFSSTGTGVTTFADLASRINAVPNEAGLLGMAFHPKFATNGQVFLSYTKPSATSPANLKSVIARYVSRNGGDTLDLTSGVELLSFDQPYTNHNGGHIAFGPDGMLYAGFGDGGSAGDPQNNSQNKNVLFGKMLRLDVDHGTTYSIPPSNPFAGGGGRGEIYAYGLRNPWRFSFDRDTGDLWVGDVGQDKFEEVDKVTLGGNYGWSIREADHCFKQPCTGTSLIKPVAEYPHADGISITGGFVYRGTAIPGLVGNYVYGDYGSGRIWGLRTDVASPTPQTLLDSGKNIAAFGQGEDGELYALDITNGQVFKLAATSGGTASTIPETLSATGCFDANDPTVPAAGLIPYDVNSPLWSDGAEKERYLAIPNGKKITVLADGDWDLPIGSVLFKTFSLGAVRVETRMFVRHADGGWAGYTYEWNAAQTDATLLETGKTKTVAQQSWTIPSRGQCMNCHTGAAGGSLGLENGQLNRDLTYPNGRTANQLYTLDHIGMFSRALPDPTTLDAFPRPDGTAALEDRARSYLHANCGFCHRPEGPGRGPADFRFQTSFADVGICDAAAEQGTLGVANAKLLVPGSPSKSVVSLRMHATTDDRMPRLGSKIVDTTGTQAVDGWIQSLTQCP